MNYAKNILLEKFHILDYIDEKSFESLYISMYKVSLTKGQIMQRDNSQCEGVPFVVSGGLKLFKTSENGREMTLYRVNEGEMCLLAALCILTDREYDFTVIAQEDTDMIMINAFEFKQLITKNPKFNQYLLTLLADKLIYTMSLHEKIHLTGVDEKLYNYLMENQEKGKVQATHSEIAQDLGTSRVVISRALGKLRKEGIIETSRNLIIVKED